MATVQDIPFRSIPHQSELFLNYLDLAPDALRFYHHPPKLEDMVYSARNLHLDGTFPRKEMASILRRQNENYGGDSATVCRINELEEPDSVAILTGQQVGLFTGPLYTIYKALTTLHICEELRQRGIHAVPLFWMDTEDHDLSEVTLNTVWEPPCSVRTINYQMSLFKEMPLCSVGSLQLPETMRQVTIDYLNHLPDATHKQEVVSLLQSTYTPGATFTLSFARLMVQLFRGSGLVFFDPQDIQVKQLSSMIFQKALHDTDAFHSALMQRNHELNDAGFSPQVTIAKNATVLFFHGDGKRRILEKRPSGFTPRNTDHTFTLEEMLDCARRTPELFSPNVLLRPLVQDHLFPTAVYVGGPSEVAYFAQIEVLYTLFNRPMPVVWLRNSFTLLEPEVADVMDCSGIEVRDCFAGKQHIETKTIRNSRFSETVAHLGELYDRLDRILTEIHLEAKAVEPSLEKALDTARRKIVHNVQHLKSQVIRFGNKQNSSAVNTADLLSNYCFPNKNLQERELGLPHFLARYGNSVLDTIREGMNIGTFAHRVIRLG